MRKSLPYGNIHDVWINTTDTHQMIGVHMTLNGTDMIHYYNKTYVINYFSFKISKSFVFGKMAFFGCVVDVLRNLKVK